MQLTDLANELLLHIFQSCPTIPSLLALSSTCKHFHSILTSHRLPTLYQAAESQYGPLSSATLIVTHNASQLPHIPRPSPPQSLALLTRLIEVGRVADKWTALYPTQKWRGEHSSDRKLLNPGERYRLRRACYRIWLYTLAFHVRSQTRYTRLQPQAIRARALLLRPWPGRQLAEMLDLQGIFRQVLHSYVCPSDGTVLRRHRQRYPVAEVGRRRGERFEAEAEGWGDEVAHYYVVEDMLKVHPGQLMRLFESVTGKREVREEGDVSVVVVLGSAKGVVEHFLAGLGDWFENNGETLCETVGVVVGDRGGDVGALREGVVDPG